MSELTVRKQKLVAFGAAIASNCLPCVEYHIPNAEKVGCSDLQIKGVAQIADKARRVPPWAVLMTAMARIEEDGSGLPETDGAACRCGRTSDEVEGSGPEPD
jgi:AhpD family alkylhydroperoxidase